MTIESGATFNDATTSSGLDIYAHDFSSDNGSTATVNNEGTFTKSGSAVTSTISTTFNNTGTVNVEAGTLDLSDGGTDVGAVYEGAGTIEFGGGTRTLSGSDVIENATLINNGTIAVISGTLDITAALSGAGTDTIENLGTLELAAANAQTVILCRFGRNADRERDVTGGSEPGISAATTTGAAMAITINGAGMVTSTAADAVDATNSGGGGNISIIANGAVTGANDGINAVENGTGSTAQGEITIGGSGNITGQSGYGISAQQSTTGLGYVSIDGTGNVTGTGSSFDGILAEVLNEADVANVTVNQTGNVTGGLSGINALTDGTGDVSVTTGSNATVTGTALYGIDARIIWDRQH